LRKNAREVLIYQDEVEIHRHPTLSRAWALRGKQPQVPAPGKNEKQVIYGGVDYKTARLTYTVAATKCGAEFIVFLIALLAAYTGRRICLVCDNGRFHHTKAVQEFLEAHRDQIRVYWLPPYCPSLNLIERLWGHLKRTILANVLYSTLADLVSAFHQGVRALNGNRSAMGFMFNHDDVTRKLATKLQRKVA
jgi:transposase